MRFSGGIKIHQKGVHGEGWMRKKKENLIDRNKNQQCKILEITIFNSSKSKIFFYGKSSLSQ